MFRGKPIIGLAGGIGSGKSFVASLFGEFGCLVIDSDEQVRRVYDDQRVKQTLRQWWGDEVFHPDGEVDRRAVAARVFDRPDERKRLERLLHPLVAEARQREMAAAADDPAVRAYVWDTPLLFETGLNRECDVVVFVEAPRDLRLERLRRSRGWDEGELARRENLQMPLDKKEEISDYTLSNTGDPDYIRSQVRDVLTRCGLLPDGK